jgi:hypothetical protein
MKRKTPKNMLLVCVTRGRTTKHYYSYGRLKDALSSIKLKPGDTFTYTKYVAGKETEATWRGNNVYSTER